ncbi:MAG TPA: POTRA domain-containing protein [Ferruginibacter sp.]|nr:POTRA domain-containing protein [Ferruginibacter sp.]HMP19804.1 POTRA domain-containing protein [Ferruginibacter sp.]
MAFVKKIFLLSLLFLCACAVAAQNTDVSTNAADKLIAAARDSSAMILVQQVNIEGNKRTKDFIILREVHFKAGDSIALHQLNQELQQARQQVYNTGLFNEVTVDVSALSESNIAVNIHLKERWYIFPILKFQLVDRNINEWIQKYHADLGRVVYGVKFTHYNLSGRRDLLRFTFLNGFTRNYALTYIRPMSNKLLTNGFSAGVGYLQNKEFIYQTSADNKPVFFNNGDFSRRQVYVNLGYTIRKNILDAHTFSAGFVHVELTDSIARHPYNPNYLKDSATAQNYIDLGYTYQYTNANNATYPLKGVLANIKVVKRGLGFSGGVNMIYAEGLYGRYWDLKNNWYASVQLLGKITLPFNQPYINQRALGYNDINLRGLELYVVDGVAYGLSRSTLKRKLFTLRLPSPIRSTKFPKIPFTVFAKTYTDWGYVYNKAEYRTNLNNKMLYSGGFGIDILTLYDINLRLEYSFNQLGKNGLFLQAQSGL